MVKERLYRSEWLFLFGFPLSPSFIGDSVSFIWCLMVFGCCLLMGWRHWLWDRSYLWLRVIVVSLGLIEFRSFHRATGLDSSKLVTTGIYQYSRNPQRWLVPLSLRYIAYGSFGACLFTYVSFYYLHASVHCSVGGALSRACFRERTLPVQIEGGEVYKGGRGDAYDA